MDSRNFSFFVFFLTVFPSLVPTFRRYERHTLSANLRKSSIQFLKLCLQEQIIPHHMKPKGFANHRGDPFALVYQHIIRDRIQTLHQEKNFYFASASHYYNLLRNSVPYDLFNLLITKAKTHIRFKVSQRNTELQRKLQVIFENSPWTKSSDPQKVTNVSS